jgi:hypothetical protein
MSQPITILIKKTPPAYKLGRVKAGSKMHAAVLNAGPVVIISASREALEITSPFLPLSGYRIDSTSGLVEIQLEGEYWAIGDPANAADAQLTYGVD